MRLLITADLHYNHPRSRAGSEELIGQMNRAGGDAVLVIGDTSVSDEDGIERCLSQFQINGPRLLVAGNHELWTRGSDSYLIFTQTLPQRIRQLGWHWLEGEPYRFGETAIVGSIGWYDYAFAPHELGIPRRFYESKISPGAAERFSEYRHLFDPGDDISPAARLVVARWNDARFVKLGRSDEAFLDELLASLRAQLDSLRQVPRVIAAIHHLPFGELLPPPRNAQWDFAKAFLGSPRIGQLLLEYFNVRELYCGHSHFPAEAQVGHIHAINIGSGYRAKTFRAIEVR